MLIGIRESGVFVLGVVGIGIHVSEGMPIGIREWSGVYVLGVVGIGVGIRVIGVFWKTARVNFLVPSDSIRIHVGFEGIGIHVSEGIPIPIRVSGGPHVFVLGIC
jgi:hypothetical protein